MGLEQVVGILGKGVNSETAADNFPIYYSSCLTFK